MSEDEPKKHHYIPKTYSRNFVNEDGYLQICDLWDECRTFPRLPDDAFVSKYLYSQPVHAENRFDNSIETFFSRTVENSWRSLFEEILAKKLIDQEEWADLVQFVGSMHTRVPLILNAVIELLREHAKRSVPNDLPPPPETLAEAHREQVGANEDTPVNLTDMIDSGTVVLQIDPHRAITSMPHLVGSMEIFQPDLSFGVPQFLHNRTKIPFISSDNPVCFFGGNKNSSHIKPYRIRNKKHFSFVFPMSSEVAMVNSTFLKKTGMHIEIRDPQLISSINSLIARFSYRYVFGNNQKVISISRKHKDHYPRPRYEGSLIGDGEVHKIDFSFGKPRKLENSWEYDFKR